MICHHVTLNTGHVATHRLDTLPTHVIEVCRKLLPSGGPIPNFAPWRVEIVGPLWTIYRGRDCPVASCGVGRGRAAPWDDLVALQAQFMPVKVSDPPGGTWLAVALLPGLALASRDDIGWLGDFERCLAAAILLPKVP